MYKLILLLMLIAISGCKDKYESILDEVSETSNSMRKCELKKLASEKPDFSCMATESKIAIERAKTLGIKDSRIAAAINVGKLQADKDSSKLISKGKFLTAASKYREKAKLERETAAFIRNNIKRITDGKNAESDYRIPKICLKFVYITDYPSTRNMRFDSTFSKAWYLAENSKEVLISNKNFNINKCIEILNESYARIDYEALKLEVKAKSWLQSASKLKSEY